MSPLSSREDWVEHLAVHYGYGDRWQSFQCSLCLEETGQGEANVTIHLEKHLHDIVIAALPTNGDDEPNSELDVDFDSADSSSTGTPLHPTRSGISGGQPSSYWSVAEAAEFPNLLRSYGSNWEAIEAQMKAKNANMVKTDLGVCHS